MCDDPLPHSNRKPPHRLDERHASALPLPHDYIRSSQLVPLTGENHAASTIQYQSQSCRSSKSSHSHLLTETSVSQASTESPKVDQTFLLSPDSNTALLDDNLSEPLANQNWLSFFSDSQCPSPILDLPHRSAAGKTAPPFTSPEWSSSTLTSARFSFPTSSTTYIDHDLTSLSDSQRKNLSLFLDSSDDEEDRHDEDIELEQIFNSAHRIPRVQHLQMRRSKTDRFDTVNDVSY